MLKLSKHSAATMVEFALVIPILLMFILVTIDLSLYFFAKNSMDRATRNLVALASVIKDIDTPAGRAAFEAKYTDVNSLPSFFISTGLVHTYTIQVKPPPSGNFAEDPFGVEINTTYHGVTGFIPVVPTTIISKAYAFKEIQEISSEPIPLDCLGNPILPNSPPVDERYCPCIGANDPLKRINPSLPGECRCPINAVCIENGTVVCSGLDCDCPTTATCGCPDPANTVFNPRTGICECFGNRQIDPDTQLCECNECAPGGYQDDQCNCFYCPATQLCGLGATPDPSGNCACKCSDPEKEYVNGKCECKVTPAECAAQGKVQLGNSCACVECDIIGDGLDGHVTPSPDGKSCVCNPEVLAQQCANADLEPDLRPGDTYCTCKPQCVTLPGDTDATRTESCSCGSEFSSAACENSGQGVADPQHCKCSGLCSFSPQPENAPTTPIEDPACPCDRDKLSILCGGPLNRHPLYCTCICTDPDPTKCGPCVPNDWVNKCANEPAGDPLRLPFDWNLYNSTGICACAEGKCTGDTVLDPRTGKCVCKQSKIDEILLNCTTGIVKQTYSQANGMTCSCDTTPCQPLATSNNNTCTCLDFSVCNGLPAGTARTHCVNGEYGRQVAIKVATCKAQGRTLDSYNVSNGRCECGPVCIPPKEIQPGIHPDEHNEVDYATVCQCNRARKAQCLAANKIFDEALCDCPETCPGVVDVNGICQVCSEGVGRYCEGTRTFLCAPVECNTTNCSCDVAGIFTVIRDED